MNEKLSGGSGLREVGVARNKTNASHPNTKEYAHLHYPEREDSFIYVYKQTFQDGRIRYYQNKKGRRLNEDRSVGHKVDEHGSDDYVTEDKSSPVELFCERFPDGTEKSYNYFGILPKHLDKAGSYFRADFDEKTGEFCFSSFSIKHGKIFEEYSEKYIRSRSWDNKEGSLTDSWLRSPSFHSITAVSL